MADDNRGSVLRGIGRIFEDGTLTGLTEGQLVRRFASGDEAAFEAIVSRFGAMVLSVCRRSLRDERDVEDAFQATFLVLLRRAGGLRDPEAIGPWLYGVAFRVASRIRARAVRRPERERHAARPAIIEPDTTSEQHELRRLIDEEIGRLPEKYRRPVVLCYVEGRSHEEAARRLRCTAGSLRGRLDRARRKLQDRLVRRGVAPAIGLGALSSLSEAAVPASLVSATVASLNRAATATAVAGSAAASAQQLADGVFRSMVAAKLRVAASFLAAGAIILAVGAAWIVTLGGSLAREGPPRPVPTPVPAAPRSVSQTQEPGDGNVGGPSIQIRVIDHRTGRPVPGASVGVASRKPGTGVPTGDSGTAVVRLPAPLPERLSLRVVKDGLVPVTLWFPTPVSEDQIPRTYDVHVYPAETIGGVVRDEQGQPVAGVRVTATIWTSSAEMRFLRDDIQEPTPTITDAQGRWQLARMPAGIDRSRVSIAFRHDDYQRLDWPMNEALDRVGRGEPAVLLRGIELTGRVTNAAGRGIAGARVVRGKDIFGGEVPRVETDGDGRFRFRHVPAGETVLTVQADGFAPALQKVEVRPGLAPVEVRLSRGRRITGQVVDARGEPVGAATVNVDGWRGLRTLEFRMMTDAHGEFAWEDAPPDSFWVDISREGYLALHHQEIPPGAAELSFTMAKILKVRGTVVDAETRHAIRAFTIVPGLERGNSLPAYWERGLEQPGRRGRFEFTFQDMTRREGRRLRIVADGYMPEVSRVIRDDEDAPVINFVLRKAVEITGVVRSPDGSPVADAEVVLVDNSEPVYFTNGRITPGTGHRVVKTKADGKFIFPPIEPTFSIVALHDRGFAEQTVRERGAASSMELKLGPWGRIEGTLRLGSRPGAGQSLTLAYGGPDVPALGIPRWDGRATTDGAGRFAFERVVPGETTIMRQILLREANGSRTIGHSHTTWVDVAPGTTSQVILGGTGRPVVGKLAAPAGTGPIDWTFSNNSLIRRLTAADRLKPVAAGKGGRRLATGGQSVKLGADGTFRMEDVQAGTYDLILVVTRPPSDPFGAGRGPEPLAVVKREVVVPAMPGGRSDEALDLGTIQVELVEQLMKRKDAKTP